MILQTTRLCDPAYLAEVWPERSNLHPQAKRTLEVAVGNMLAFFAAQSDAEAIVDVIENGLMNRVDVDVTYGALAEGAYEELVNEGILPGLPESKRSAA